MGSREHVNIYAKMVPSPLISSAPRHFSPPPPPFTSPHCQAPFSTAPFTFLLQPSCGLPFFPVSQVPMTMTKKSYTTPGLLPRRWVQAQSRAQRLRQQQPRFLTLVAIAATATGTARSTPATTTMATTPSVVYGSGRSTSKVEKSLVLQNFTLLIGHVEIALKDQIREFVCKSPPFMWDE